MPSSVANMYYVIAVIIYARVKPSEGSAAITKGAFPSMGSDRRSFTPIRQAVHVTIDRLIGARPDFEA